jgi:hypothetical protein
MPPSEKLKMSLKLGAALQLEHQLERQIVRLCLENKRLRERIVELQRPQGEHEEQVAEWLRERGYTVTKGVSDVPGR